MRVKLAVVGNRNRRISANLRDLRLKLVELGRQGGDRGLRLGELAFESGDLGSVGGTDGEHLALQGLQLFLDGLDLKQGSIRALRHMCEDIRRQ